MYDYICKARHPVRHVPSSGQATCLIRKHKDLSLTEVDSTSKEYLVVAEVRLQQGVKAESLVADRVVRMSAKLHWLIRNSVHALRLQQGSQKAAR